MLQLTPVLEQRSQILHQLQDQVNQMVRLNKDLDWGPGTVWQNHTLQSDLLAGTPLYEFLTTNNVVEAGTLDSRLITRRIDELSETVRKKKQDLENLASEILCEGAKSSTQYINLLDGSKEQVDNELEESELQPERCRAASTETISLEDFNRSKHWRTISGNGGSSTWSSSVKEQLLTLRRKPKDNIAVKPKPIAWSKVKTIDETAEFRQKRNRETNTTSVFSFGEFMRGIPLFHSVRGEDLEQIERQCKMQHFVDKEEILAEGVQSQHVWVIRDGKVALTQTDRNTNQRIVGMVLTQGDYFGISAVMRSKSVASYQAQGDVLCIRIPAKLFEQSITNPNLIGASSANSTLARSEEVQSLSQHLEKFSELLQLLERYFTPQNQERNDQEPAPPSTIRRKQHRSSIFRRGADKHDVEDATSSSTPQTAVVSNDIQYNITETVNMHFNVENKSLLMELLSSFSPELDVEDVMERMVSVTKRAFQVDRVYLFLVDADQEHLTLAVSKEAQGFKMPMRGFCGHVAQTGELLNVSDAYRSNLFDPTLDLSTSFHSKQVLTAPVFQAPGQVAGVLQCLNTHDNLAFTMEDQVLVTIVCEQLGQVMRMQTSRYKLTADTTYTRTHTLRDTFSIRIISATIGRLHNHLRCTAQIFHGGVQLGKTLAVPLVPTRAVRVEGQTLYRAEFNSCLQLNENNHAAGWCGMPLFGFDHSLRTGCLNLRLWPNDCPTPNATTLENKYADAEHTVLEIELPTFEKPVVYEVQRDSEGATPQTHVLHKPLEWFLSRMGEAERISFERLIAGRTGDLTMADRNIVWRLRYALSHRPHVLPLFLLSTDWFNPSTVAETYRLLYIWAQPTPIQALQLLDHKFPDPKVRAFAVHVLGTLKDEELRRYMLQLTQVLKFEPFHDSALSRFLLRRALANPTQIGHILFWHLKAELYDPVARERYGVLLELYMRFCGEHRTALGHQMLVMNRLMDVAEAVKNAPSKETRLATLKERLRQCDFPASFQLPLNPDIRVTGVIVDKCRVMESKKKPLWLVFTLASQNEDTSPCVMQRTLTVMFKAGDDLRQDQLTLQVLSIMDQLWQAEGLDLCMSPYGCISTGDMEGMLQIVGNAETLANIVANAQGKHSTKFQKKVAAAFDALYQDDIFVNWLKNQMVQQRTDSVVIEKCCRIEAQLDITQESQFDAIRERFMRSCAGYCVATFVLGIGDRHNDNIMLKRTGELFHIDFGHFLGNWKYKLGIKRERAPFVFTPAFAAVLDGEGSTTFQNFVNLACEAFHILRKHQNLLTTLFSLMLSCGIPELQKDDDINYLADSLMPELSATEAEKRFKDVIIQCLRTRATQLNDAAHLLRHA